MSLTNTNRILQLLVNIFYFNLFLALIWLLCFVFYLDELNLIRWVSYLSPFWAFFIIAEGLFFFIIKKNSTSAICFILASCILYPHLNISSLLELKDQSSFYKIMTYSKMGRNKRIDLVANVLLKEKPDVFFLQEINVEETNELLFLIRDIYESEELYYDFDGRHGLVVSRFEVVSHVKKINFFQKLKIIFPSQIVSVWNVHLPKAIVSNNFQHEMTNELISQISALKGAKIIAGDFNSTVINYPYLEVKKYLNNAFEMAGNGFGFTFPTSARNMGRVFAFLRIDHIFLSNDFKIHQSYVLGEFGGSDHFPVIAYVSL
ncbi:MAG: vancomycin resistance protein VanJ [Colwellia sp.]|jgi:vancomycin resistance protein VanJ